MKVLLTLTCCISFLLSPGSAHGQDKYQKLVAQYRDSVDRAFRNPETSILPKESLEQFHGLDYFAYDPSFRVKAKFNPIIDGKAVKMKTSGKRTPEYRPYGTLTFKLKRKKCVLTLYQYADASRPELKNHLLLAFTDPTNGFETYGGGRYLEYTTGDVAKEMMIDFNACFNPYCAYTDGYNCVVPPAENAMKVAVRAGVKKFHE